MATSAKSEQPEDGDKEVLEFADEPPEGPEDFHGIQDTDTAPHNKLDEVAGSDAKKKAQLAWGRAGRKSGREATSLEAPGDKETGPPRFASRWAGSSETAGANASEARSVFVSGTKLGGRRHVFHVSQSSRALRKSGSSPRSPLMPPGSGFELVFRITSDSPVKASPVCRPIMLDTSPKGESPSSWGPSAHR